MGFSVFRCGWVLLRICRCERVNESEVRKRVLDYNFKSRRAGFVGYIVGMVIEKGKMNRNGNGLFP